MVAEAAGFMGAEDRSTVVAEAFTAAEGDFVAALPAVGTMATAVAFAEEPRRARVIRIRTGDPAGSRLVRLAILPSATGSVPGQMA